MDQFPDITIKMIEKLFLNENNEELDEEDKRMQAKTKANMKLMSKGTAAKDMWLKKGAKGGLMALVANNNSVNTV